MLWNVTVNSKRLKAGQTDVSYYLQSRLPERPNTSPEKSTGPGPQSLCVRPVVSLRISCGLTQRSEVVLVLRSRFHFNVTLHIHQRCDITQSAPLSCRAPPLTRWCLRALTDSCGSERENRSSSSSQSDPEPDRKTEPVVYYFTSSEMMKCTRSLTVSVKNTTQISFCCLNQIN